VTLQPTRHRGQVVATAALTPRMRRVTMRLPTLTALPLRPAQDVGLVFIGADGRELRRRYTIRHADAAAGTIDLDGILHGHDGPGAAWFEQAQVGDTIEVVGPRGKVVVDPSADWHLFAGDESGLPAFAELIAGLPTGSTAVTVVEVADAAEEIDLPDTTHWVRRDGATPGSTSLLADVLASVALPAGRGAAYLLGESRAMVALRPALEARGVAHADTFLKGYWNVGRITAG
jgi:NADPH-dependent ferric siderophore reductase